MNEVTNDNAILETYQTIKEILTQARSEAYRAVNFAMVQAYWNIGKVIVEEEQRGRARAGYGEYLIKEISAKLTKEFGKGFTITNVKYFRQFYMSFSIGHALRGQLPVIRSELSWPH